MGSGFFTTVFVQPLYNGLVFLLDFIPGADAGIAIIIFTVVVRLILFPLSRKSIETQLKMRSYESELDALKQRFKGNKQKLAEETMRFYREKGLNPLSGFVLILIQIPIIFALYKIFLHSGLPTIDSEMLYKLVNDPGAVSMMFLGIVDITAKNYILAAICAISQFFQINFSLPKLKPKVPGATFSDDLARSMNIQMKYIFPVIVFFISYSLSGTVAIYWITSNLFAIGQELYIRKRLVLNK